MLPGDRTTPGQVFDALVAQAQANAETTKQEPSPLEKSVGELTELVKKQSESFVTLDKKIEAVAARPASMGMRQDPSQSGSSNPIMDFEQATGIPSDRFTPAVASIAEAVAKQMRERELEPIRRANEAVQKYQESHKDFNLSQFQQFVMGNPEVQQIVSRAENAGAYEAAIEYGELRRQMDEKIKTEARGRAQVQKRDEFVRSTRPDAQIVGSAGAGPGGGRSGAAMPMTEEQIATIYAHANAGNWKPFEEAFVNPNLPSEEEFQRLAQS